MGSRARVLALLLVAGCGRYRYAYAPTTTTGAEIAGHGAVVNVMPPEAPKGEVRIASLGVAAITPPANVGLTPFSALFVRFVLDNQSAEPWIFDQASQRIELDERRTIITIWALTPTGERPPVVQVPARSTASVDVLFPIGGRQAGDIPKFDVRWTVRAGSHVEYGRASFRRETELREPAPAAFEPYTPPSPLPRPNVFPAEPCLP